MNTNAPGKGTISILNVSGGDIRLTYDKTNPGERIRTARVIKDMLRRGYALLVEVERNGEIAYERAYDFDEEAGAYIIADFDPVAPETGTEPKAKASIGQGDSNHVASKSAAVRGATAAVGDGASDEPGESESEPASKRRGHPAGSSGGRSRVPVEGTRAVAVGRSSGG